MRTIKNPYDTSIISFQHSCSVVVLIVWSIRLKGSLMNFKVGVEGTYECASFRGELCIHIISYDACHSDRQVVNVVVAVAVHVERWY